MKAEIVSLFKQLETIIDADDQPDKLARAGKAALAGLRAEIEVQDAEIERLAKRDMNASISLFFPVGDYPYETVDLKVVDVGVADNCYMTESAEVNKLIADLSSIRSSLSLLGDGEPVELAKLAAKVMRRLAKRMSFERTETIDSRIKAAVEAVNGGSNA